MGISSSSLRDLIAMKRAGYLSDCAAVAELGAQQLTGDFIRASDLLQELSALYSVKLPDLGEAVSQERFTDEAPFAQPLWEALGYRYLAIDIDGRPSSLALDLNCDQVPMDHRNAYGLVTNLGTSEHVANQANAFKVIHDLTAVGGIMMHRLPAQGHMMHGLINYNPKFFWMLARSNDYRTVHMDVEGGEEFSQIPDNVFDYIVQFRVAERRDYRFRVAEAALNVILKKVHDSEYVPPLDLPTGTRPPNEAIRQRYWSVFSQWMKAGGKGR